MIQDQRINCKYCQKPADRACSHIKCPEFPFICSTECLNGLRIGQKIHDHNCDQNLTVISLKNLESHIVQIQNVGDLEQYNQITQLVNRFVHKTRQLLGNLLGILNRDYTLKLKQESQRVIERLTQISMNPDLKGQEIGLITDRKNIYLDYDVLTKSNTLKETFRNFLDTLNKQMDKFSKVTLKIKPVREGSSDSQSENKSECVLNQNPLPQSHYFELAKELYRKQKYSQAYQELKRVRVWDPQSTSEIQQLQGECQLRLGKFTAARRHFQRCIEMKNPSANAYFRRAELYQVNHNANLVQQEKAIECFMNAYAIQNSYLYMLRCAISHKLLKQYDKAIGCLDIAIERNNKCPDSYNEKGLCLFEKGDIPGAIKCYSDAISLSHNPQYYQNRGKANAILGDQQKSKLDYSLYRILESKQESKKGTKSPCAPKHKNA